MATSSTQPLVGSPEVEAAPVADVEEPALGLGPTLSFYQRGNRQIMFLMVAALPVAVGIWLAIFFLLPDIQNMDTATDRHELAFKCIAVAALMTMVLNMEAVSHSRRNTPFAVDPIAQEGKEPYTMKVNIQVLDHTMQQLIVFAVGLLGLASYSADGKQIRAVVATTVIFVISRWVYWAGYHYAPRMRTPGNISFLQSVIVLLYVAGRFGHDMAGVPGVMLCLIPFVGAEVLFVLDRRLS